MTANTNRVEENTGMSTAVEEKKLQTGTLADYLRHIEKADEARHAGDIDTALTEYFAAVSIRPNMFQPNMHLAQLLRVKGLNGDALTYFGKAHELQPDNPAILSQIAELVYLSGDAEGAKGVLCDALAVNDQYVPAIIALGDLLARDGEYEKATALLQAAIENDPHQSPLWVSIGTVMQVSGDKENARIFYEEALRLNPNAEVAIHNLKKLDEAGA
jgi:Flp pilus assembly protein TadD